MTSSMALFSGSVRQLLPLKRTIALAVMQIAPAILFLFAANDRSSEAGFQIVVEITTVAYFSLVLPIVAIVLASSALGVERRDQTLSFITLRPISRRAVAAIKVLASAVAALMLASIGAIALVIAYTARYAFDGELLIGILVGAAVSTIAYACMFVPLGFITDRAVIIGLAYLLVFENGVVTALPGLATLSPARLGVSTLGALVDGAQLWIPDVAGQLAFSFGSAFLALAFYVVGGVLLTAYLMTKRDLA